ncbi:MAG: hypothetical protein WBX00_26925 [Isosphaeraceae bacterium]
MFCLNIMRIALELAKDHPVYEGLATKFFQHYAYIAAAMKHMGNQTYSLWDDKDGFFYDVLRRPDGSFHKFRVRSLVGLVPLFAIERLEQSWIEHFPSFRSNLEWFLRNRRDLVHDIVHTVDRGGEVTHVLTIVDRLDPTSRTWPATGGSAALSLALKRSREFRRTSWLLTAWYTRLIPS